MFLGGSIIKVAILVDGGFYRMRARSALGDKTPKERAHELHKYCLRHLYYHNESFELYRIFYYDCPPMEKVLWHPLLKTQIDYSKTDL